MKTTTIRTVYAAGTVSTVRVRDGRSCWFETAIISHGVVTEPVRSADKAAAGCVHDRACDFVQGRRDASSVRDARWAAELDAETAEADTVPAPRAPDPWPSWRARPSRHRPGRG